MIYVTGDTHGDFTRLGSKKFKKGKSLSRDDYVIICGDFGGLWAGGQRDQYWLEWLAEKPFTVLFVDGNHENFDLLNSFSVSEWNGGKVHRIRDNVIHLMRGQIFTIEFKKFFTMGGAASHDIWDGILDPEDPFFEEDYWRMRRVHKAFRVKGKSWWPEEMPSRTEYEDAIRSLNAANWNVDFVISHCAPSNIVKKLSESYATDELTDFLDVVYFGVPQAKWYFGHYHQDIAIDKGAKLMYTNLEYVV